MAAVPVLDEARFGYLKPTDVARLAEAYRFSGAAHAGPDAPVRRALHLASAGGGRNPRRLAPGRPGADGRAAARRDGGHLGHQGRDLRHVRQARRRPGRRRVQARQDRVPVGRGRAGRELPQDAAGDGARRARHPDQARRPAAQHAHARRGGARQAPARGARDDGDLRADRQPARPERAVPRAAGARLLAHAPAALPRARQGDARGARQPARGGRQDRGRDQGASSPRPASRPRSPAARSTSTRSTAR